ncbi:MAG: cohesin domain-containing protein, partial [Candidatus Rokubacteria bacterium]|nr:cohesin domain-containing protein [Candidatus Rokubacteria bacterium]
MKHRIRSWLLGVILALPLFAPFAAYADSATLYLSPASGSVSKGSILTISVRENSGNEPVNSVQANLSYPANLLDFVSISSSSAWGVVAQNSGGGGSVQIARGALPAVSGDQLVASVRFKAKTDSGTASINFASGSAVVSANSNTDVKSGERGGNYTLKAPAPAASAPAEAPKDTIPPKIDKVEATEITATTAVITWTTSEPSTSEVTYGPSQKYGIAAADTNTVTDHKVTLSSPLITPGTKYHYMVKSIDPAGNAASSPDATFTTIGATLEAKVVNQSNKPVSGATVAFGDVSGKTDKNGKVTLKNLPLGKQTGTVSYRGKQAPAAVQLDTLDKN